MRFPEGPGDSFDFGRAPARRQADQASQQAAAALTRRGRKLGTLDAGTVAIAMNAFQFYWVMPMMAGRRRRRRPAPPPGGAST